MSAPPVIPRLDGKAVHRNAFYPQLQITPQHRETSLKTPKNPTVKTELPPKIYTPEIDYSQRRRVMSCLGPKVTQLRRPNIPLEEGIQPPMGIARGQHKGLSYDSERHPINGKISMLQPHPYVAGAAHPFN